jgi:hypothetical protein
MEREKDIEAWIRRRVEDLGGEFWKFTSPGRDGVPDRIAIFPDGRIVFVELKTERGRLSKVQAHVCKRLIELNQQVCIVFGMEGAEEFLEDMAERSAGSWIYGKEVIL